MERSRFIQGWIQMLIRAAVKNNTEGFRQVKVFRIPRTGKFKSVPRRADKEGVPALFRRYRDRYGL